MFSRRAFGGAAAALNVLRNNGAHSRGPKFWGARVHALGAFSRAAAAAESVPAPASLTLRSRRYEARREAIERQPTSHIPSWGWGGLSE